MKKILFIVIVFLVVSVPVFAVYDAESIDTQALEESLKETEYYNPYGSVGDLLRAILENRLELDGSNILENILQILFSGIRQAIPTLASLLCIAILLSVIENLKILSGKTEEMALLGGKIIFCIVLFTSFFSTVQEAKESLNGISVFSQTLMPVIITLLAACGAQGSATSMAPSMAMLSSTLIGIVSYIIFPMILAACAVSAVNSVLPGSKLSGVADMFKSIASWLMGGIFTVFSAVIAIQGMVAGASDGISIKSIKYAINSSVPIIGGSVSESLTMVLASGIFLKSAAGISGIIIIAGILLLPVINICGYIRLLRCFNACVSPFSDSFVTGCVRNVCDCLKLVMAAIFGVGVLYFIYLGILAGAGSSLL